MRRSALTLNQAQTRVPTRYTTSINSASRLLSIIIKSVIISYRSNFCRIKTLKATLLVREKNHRIETQILIAIVKTHFLLPSKTCLTIT